MKKYCFCISAFNEELSIEECISSVVLASKDFDSDIFILDNGSKDGTKKKIEKLSKKYTFNFKSFKRNVYLQEARDYLLKNCRSEYAIFMDADGKANENYLNVLDESISQDFAIYSGPVIQNKEIKNPYYELHYKSLVQSDSDKNFLIGANFVVHRESAIKSGGFPNLTYNRGDETPLIIQMKKKGYKHLYIEDLKTTNNFADNISDFYRFGFYEGVNSYILNSVYLLRNFILYDLVRSMFILGILISLLGTFLSSQILIFSGVFLIFLRIISRFRYWQYVLINSLSNFYLRGIVHLFNILGFHLVLDLGYWYARVKKIIPNKYVEYKK